MEEVETAMETDTAPPVSASPSSKRLAIKNTIQTNFDDDYVFQIAANQEISNLAVSLSANIIKFYSSATGQYFGDCKGHTASIHEISFSVPCSPQAICSCSSDGTVRVWDSRTFQQHLGLGREDARSLASDKWNLDNVDYFVDCHYSSSDDRLWVIGGMASGTLGYFPIMRDNKGTIGFAEAILEGGHSGVVRSVLPTKGGIFGWTGGEDGRLCCWSSVESASANPGNRSWISNSLVSRSHKDRTKLLRHHPY